MIPGSDEDRRIKLRAFLRKCRARLRPADVGLPNSARRRVVGLRREEVAELAEISSDWYRWFESGRSVRVSPAFLSRLGRALKLTSAEQQHLYHLALPELYDADTGQILTWPDVQLPGPLQPVRDAAIPHGFHTVTPRLVTAEPAKLVRFLKDAFGATGEFSPDRPAQMTIGDSIVMISATGPRPPTSSFFYLYVQDVDATYARALRAGAVPLEEPQEMPYGDRRAMVTDTLGNDWQIAMYRGAPAERFASI